MDVSRRSALSIAIVLLAFVAAWAPGAPSSVERWFSTSIYPAIQRTVTGLSNLVPFALLDVFIAAGLVIVGIALVRAIRTGRRERRVGPLAALLGRLSVAGAIIYLAFLCLWGFNYRRVAMEDRLLIEPGPPPSAAVAELGTRAAEQLNALYDEAHASGWPDPVQSVPMRRAFGDIQRALSDASPAEPGRLKRTILGPYFRWTSVDGMINPFGLEVLANPDLLPFERPFVAGHEWAHLAGYADESEASFVGWLTCLRGDAAAQYSGWLALYWQVASEVDRQERARIDSLLAAGPRRDLEAMIARVRRGEWPWLRDAGWRVYDRYLKANRVDEGIRSYGAALTLVLGARFDDGWIPVRRETQQRLESGP